MARVKRGVTAKSRHKKVLGEQHPSTASTVSPSSLSRSSRESTSTWWRRSRCTVGSSSTMSRPPWATAMATSTAISAITASATASRLGLCPLRHRTIAPAITSGVTMGNSRIPSSTSRLRDCIMPAPNRAPTVAKPSAPSNSVAMIPFDVEPKPIAVPKPTKRSLYGAALGMR